MKPEHQPTSSELSFKSHFPYAIHPKMHGNQNQAFKNNEEAGGPTMQELPTGSGKTAYGFTVLRALRAKYGDGTYFYVTPNKALVDQVKGLYPEFHVVYGRNEYDCQYYEEPKYKADQIPCSLLGDCPFRVDQETGATYEAGVTPCAYLHAKYVAKQSTLVVCTLSFYLFTTMFSNEWGEIKGVVVDEAHLMPDIIREALSYEITDSHLRGIVDFLHESGIEQWKIFDQFHKQMVHSVARHGNLNPLLDDYEIEGFIKTLQSIKRTALETEIKKVLARKRIDDKDKIEVIKKLEMIIRDLYRYTKSFEYSIASQGRSALNYTYAYLKHRKGDKENMENVLYVKCYFVPPIIKKIFPAEATYYMSATFGNIDAFRMATGITVPFYAHRSEFPVENARIYLPIDVEDLSQNKSRRNSKTKTLKRIIEACAKFAKHGHRSLVLVVSDEERNRFLQLSKDSGLSVLTYSDELKPKVCIQEFKKGVGDVLLGTMAQYGAGIDLPDEIAPIIFALRPAYAPPNDPKSLYEEKRFKNSRWVLWNAKEMNRILQVRGRNIRSVNDRGVTFCMSAQYRKIVLRSLPKWLEDAYVYKKTFEEAIDDAIVLLKKRK